MTYGFISESSDKRIIDYLRRQGVKPILLPSFSKLAKPVSSHADMLLFVCGDKIITYKEYFEENSLIFEPFKDNLILEENSPTAKYPGDIGLNFLELSNTLYGRTDCIAPTLSKLFPEQKFIKQGYASCSSLKLSETAVITQDTSIEKALQKDSFDVLKIGSGNILLEGYCEGFIGGATCVLPVSHEVVFFGKISDHPDFEKIKEFIKKHNMTIKEFDFPLTDFGGVKFFEM